MLRGLMRVMRRMRRLRGDIVHRAGMQRSGLGGEHGEPAAQQQRSCASEGRDVTHRQANYRKRDVTAKVRMKKKRARVRPLSSENTSNVRLSNPVVDRSATTTPAARISRHRAYGRPATAIGAGIAVIAIHYAAAEDGAKDAAEDRATAATVASIGASTIAAVGTFAPFGSVGVGDGRGTAGALTSGVGSVVGEGAFSITSTCGSSAWATTEFSGDAFTVGCFDLTAFGPEPLLSVEEGEGALD